MTAPSGNPVAGLDPATHVFAGRRYKDVDGRDTPGRGGRLLGE